MSEVASSPKTGSLLPPVFFRLRSARPRDSAEICALLIRSISEICARDYDSECVLYWNANKTPENLEREIRDPRNYFVVAQDESGRLIGVGQLHEISGEIRLCSLLPDVLGKGVGRALLGNLLQRARDGGHAEVRLNSTITSRSFYEKAGFRVLEEKLNLRPPAGVPYISMIRRL